MNKVRPLGLLVSLILVTFGCSMPTQTPVPVAEVEPTPLMPASISEEPTVEATASAAPVEVVPVSHVVSPAAASSTGMLVYDVESSGTAPEKRAPYGDSYDINRLERPFQQDMTYIPDMDIDRFTVSEDDQWFYVAINLVGTDPNNAIGINYGVELDIDRDGFGDYIIWAQGPYTSTWDTANVTIFEDTNHDTAGLSSGKSDAPFTGDGYETQIFHGGAGDADPDLAWVRLGTGDANIEFSFRKVWSGKVFMLGVISDAGLRDVKQLDYVDRFTEEEAGSPVKDKKYYPLGALYAVDNTCQEAFGFKPTGYETKLCPRAEQPHASGGDDGGTTTTGGCTNPGQHSSEASCQAAGCRWYPGCVTAACIAYVAPSCGNP